MPLLLLCPAGNHPVLWLSDPWFFPGAPKFRHGCAVGVSDTPASRVERETLHPEKE
jgi:hypothetical protein